MKIYAKYIGCCYVLKLVEILFPFSAFPVGIYLLKVSNRNTGTRCEICSKLTRKTPEQGQ